MPRNTFGLVLELVLLVARIVSVSANNEELSRGTNRRERRYWVVSPNVKPQDKTVGEWSKASIREHAVFMGWPPDAGDGGKMIGHKFAGLAEPGIEPNDVVLIARRHGG